MGAAHFRQSEDEADGSARAGQGWQFNRMKFDARTCANASESLDLIDWSSTVRSRRQPGDSLKVRGSFHRVALWKKRQSSEDIGRANDRTWKALKMIDSSRRRPLR